jgi:Tol biopolymer transport system component
MPKFSPDGKEIAFVEERNIVRVTIWLAKLQEPFYRKVETTVILMAILVSIER